MSNNNKKEKKSKKFKGITDNEDHINYVGELVKQGNNITHAVLELCDKLDYPYSDSLRRAFSYTLEKEGVTDNKKEKEIPLEATEEFKEALVRELPKSKYYIVSWAQSDSEINHKFLDNIEAYAKHINAEIIISCGRYKNPNSLEASKNIVDKEKNKTVWHPRLKNYLYASRLDLTDKLVALCDVKVMPTATLPISGLNGFTANNSCILPHPKVQLQSLPILDGYNPKLVLSTGAVTLPNYSDTKAGKKGHFHHQLGFVIVEVEEGGVFHMRQVQTDDSGDFFDLWYHVCEGEVLNTKVCNQHYKYNIVWGDLHVHNRCKDSVRLAIDLTNDLSAEEVVLHDIFDGHSINHHEEKDPFKLLEKEEDGSINLEDEIEETINFTLYLDYALGSSRLNVVASNHSDFLDRHLRNVDWRKMPNKKMYLKLANVVAEGLAPKGVFNYLLEQAFRKKYPKSHTFTLRTYGYGDSLRIKDWELGLHGDLGTNGARGGIQQFKNLSTKTITGHTHSPQRQDGSIIAGTLTKLRLGYNKGLSSWLKGVVIIYPNGKATNVHFIKNSYTTFKD